MARPVRDCRYCGVRINLTATGQAWNEQGTTTSKCSGSVNGHRPLTTTPDARAKKIRKDKK